MNTPAATAPERPNRWIWGMPLAGIILSLGFPNEIVPGRAGDHPSPVIAWFALLPLWWAILTLPPARGRLAALLYGFGFYAGALTWMRLFGYLPWALLAGAMALTPWLALVLTQRMRLPRWLVPAAYALTWTALEWLRGQGLYGFAWAEIGSSQVDGTLRYLATLGGVPLITLLVMLATGAAMLRILDRQAPRHMLAIACAALVALTAAGWWQAHRAIERWRLSDTGQEVAVVQPCTERGLTPMALRTGISADEADRRLRALLTLSYQAMPANLPGTPISTSPHDRLIIWSESALCDYPTHPELPDLCRATHSALLTGAPGDGISATGEYEHRNSAYLFDTLGARRERYDKINLVPFGEFVPLRPLVERFYTVRARDVRPGERWTVIRATGHRLGVGICFESTFTAIARAYAHQGAAMLAYITNDAWFQQTSAVRQHFNHARFRALETGLPVARAAVTGISGFIAPDGSILGEIPTYQEGVLTRYLPDGTAGTVYTHGGWLFGPSCLALVLLLLVIRWRARPLLP